MTSESKHRLTVIAAAATIVASCSWIYFSQVRTTKVNVALHQHVGEVLAEQVQRVVGTNGQIVILTIQSREWPELDVQIEAFKAALKRLGVYTIRNVEFDTKDQPKYGLGSGLSGRRYVRTVKKNLNADAFVSFIGVPGLKPDEVAELASKPRLIAEARSPKHLSVLFENNLIEVAVVSRFQFPSPNAESPRTAEQWFTKRYQIVTPADASSLPKEN